MTVDQGDVDGELIVALDKFSGPIQRVDQPEPFPTAAFAKAGGGRFLGQHRDGGGQLRQPAQDTIVRSQIGGGHRALVGFLGHAESAGVHIQDTAARLPGDRLNRLHQGGQVDVGSVAHDAGSLLKGWGNAATEGFRSGAALRWMITGCGRAADSAQAFTVCFNFTQVCGFKRLPWGAV